jgi:hypothetical protein
MIHCRPITSHPCPRQNKPVVIGMSSSPANRNLLGPLSCLTNVRSARRVDGPCFLGGTTISRTISAAVFILPSVYLLSLQLREAFNSVTLYHGDACILHWQSLILSWTQHITKEAHTPFFTISTTPCVATINSKEHYSFLICQ